MIHQVKDPALSRQQLGLLRGYRLDPGPGNRKDKKNGKKKKKKKKWRYTRNSGVWVFSSVDAFQRYLGIPPVVQWNWHCLCSARMKFQSPNHSALKDPVMPKLWQRSQLWLISDPLLGNSICCGAAKKRGKNVF